MQEKFPEMDSQQKQKLYNAIKDESVSFVFFPSVELRDKIAKGSDELLNQLPEGMPGIILGCPRDSGIRLDADLVMKVIEGTVDAKNAHLLAHGDIRVIGF
tara:strand:- start:32867 stop:33169 length:303 start_codon:yes stop_codon:yes gene_type:complete